jgi:hypothetical protein
VRRSILSLLAAALLLLAFAGPAAAHLVIVEKSGTVRWVGGDSVPDPAKDAPPMFGPFSVPPSHATGLPTACMKEQSPVVTFAAPASFTGCHHHGP